MQIFGEFSFCSEMFLYWSNMNIERFYIQSFHVDRTSAFSSGDKSSFGEHLLSALDK